VDRKLYPNLKTFYDFNIFISLHYILYYICHIKFIYTLIFQLLSTVYTIIAKNIAYSGLSEGEEVGYFYFINIQYLTALYSNNLKYLTTGWGQIFLRIIYLQSIFNIPTSNIHIPITKIDSYIQTTLKPLYSIFSITLPIPEIDIRYIALLFAFAC
jgi:hypothetical protein